MIKRFAQTLGASFLAVLVTSSVGAAETNHSEIARQTWTFSGLFGQYDRAQLQRGFQVYKEVCSACHSLDRLSFRNLVQPGGPEFPQASVKQLAHDWPNQITDGPNDQGKMFERPAKLPDPIRGPYHNEEEARAAHNGALPPDLSLITKARGIEEERSWWEQPFLMLGDILGSYQEAGSDYVYAVLTGFSDPPAGFKMVEGKFYNKAFPGHQISMPPPLSDGVVTYQDGTAPKLDNYARDVVAFLSWAADPSLDTRKRIGWAVILYLIVTTGLLYLGKKRIWSAVKH